MSGMLLDSGGGATAVGSGRAGRASSRTACTGGHGGSSAAVPFPRPESGFGSSSGCGGGNGSRLRAQSMSVGGGGVDIPSSSTFLSTSKTPPRGEGRIRASSQPICVPSALQAPSTDKYAGSSSRSPKAVEEKYFEYYESKSWLMYTSMKEKGMNPDSPLEGDDERGFQDDAADASLDENLLFEME